MVLEILIDKGFIKTQIPRDAYLDHVEKVVNDEEMKRTIKVAEQYGQAQFWLPNFGPSDYQIGIDMAKGPDSCCNNGSCCCGDAGDEK